MQRELGISKQASLQIRLKVRRSQSPSFRATAPSTFVRYMSRYCDGQVHSIFQPCMLGLLLPTLGTTLPTCCNPAGWAMRPVAIVTHGAHSQNPNRGDPPNAGLDTKAAYKDEPEKKRQFGG